MNHHPIPQPSLTWLTDPTVFAVNRLPAHSDHCWYQNEEELMRGETALRQSLDGQWRFCWSRNPTVRPEGFWQEGADLSGFGSIAVPGHIEAQGYGQLQYINSLYPWEGHHQLQPPEIPWEDTPVGSYVREFDLYPALLGKRVCVSFQGVEQAFYLWLNGQFIGYSEDSFTPADFDLTGFLRPAGNRLCVEVYRHSSAGWLEDQDFFRFFGIFRPVYLYAKPALHAEDIWLRAELAADNATGILAPRLTLSGETAGASVTCRITDPLCRVLTETSLALDGEDRILLPDICPWSHGRPALYQVLLTLRTADGAAAEYVPYRVGFRRFELKNGLMLLNGERVLFNGVNRHEWNPETGRAIQEADMVRAMETFRRNHINAVRTSHYPNQSAWYRLCDENGIYMIDEANLESHGTWFTKELIAAGQNVPGNRPEWTACVVDRANSMFQRDKNHPAVLFWSCGNESYAGEGILAMSRFFHAQDPSRLVHYEGVFHNRAYDEISDVESRMYARPEEIRAYLEGKPAKPFLLCEYMHDMGNSIGGMEEYIRLGEAFPQYQGGFIWDYMDQALWHTDPLGRRVLGYGGDFGDRPTDYNFSANGIVFADGEEKPAMQEVRYWYAAPAARAAQDAANACAAAESARAIAAKHREDALRAAAAPELTITCGTETLGVRGQGFEVLFALKGCGPVSLRANGAEWLYRAPTPALWRASTENDKGNGFAQRSAAWLAADAFPCCKGGEVSEAAPRRVAVRYFFTFAAVPGAQVALCYTVDAGGTLLVEAEYHGAPGLPELPAFGVRMTLPCPAARVDWTGLSGETYPDRKKGGVFGAHSETPNIPAYLVPQDCGMHMDTHRAALILGGASGHADAALELTMEGSPFAFSALPYTPQELESAGHREELPQSNRTVLTVLGAVRGVGGIDSWGADVQPPYRVSGEENHRLAFRMKL